MRTQRTNPFLVLLTAIMLCAAACGSSTDLSVGAEGTEPAAEAPGASESVDLSGRISEQDLAEARRIFDAAKARWEGRTPTAYTFRAGVESINTIEIDFDEDGVGSGERVIFGEANPAGWAAVPRSVAEAFDAVEGRIAAFERGEVDVPSPDDCGNHFNAEFDPERGAPHYYDSLGPCDDGVGIRISVFETGTVVDGPVIPAEPCSEGDFFGAWSSNEGDAPAIVLTLADGGSTREQDGDVTEIGEWFCSGSTLITITNNGEEVELATVNDDGALVVDSIVLARAER